MAKRTRRPNHNEGDKGKLRAGQLLNLLRQNALGTLANEMSMSRIRSAEIYLKKYMPDLAATQMSVESQETVRYVEVPRKAPDTNTWLQDHADPHAVVDNAAPDADQTKH